jgi:hypothetical protein
LAPSTSPFFVGGFLDDDKNEGCPLAARASRAFWIACSVSPSWLKIWLNVYVDLELKDQGQSLSPEPLGTFNVTVFSSGGFLDDDKNKGCHL